MLPAAVASLSSMTVYLSGLTACGATLQCRPLNPDSTLSPCSCTLAPACSFELAGPGAPPAGVSAMTHSGRTFIDVGTCLAVRASESASREVSEISVVSVVASVLLLLASADAKQATWCAERVQENGTGVESGVRSSRRSVTVPSQERPDSVTCLSNENSALPCLNTSLPSSMPLWFGSTATA